MLGVLFIASSDGVATDKACGGLVASATKAPST